MAQAVRLHTRPLYDVRKSGRQSRSFRLTARTVRRLTDCTGRET
jgi:hypothetical protein